MGKWKTAVLAVFIVAVLSFGAFRWQTGRALDAAKQRVRDAGYPVTYAELHEFYARPEADENQAYLLRFAMDAMVLAGPRVDENLPIAGQAELPHRSESIPEEQVLAMRSYVLQNLDAVDAVFEAFEYEECRFPIDMNAGPAMQLGHLARLRSLARILSVRSLLATLNGDTEAATQQLIGTLDLADSLEDEPVLISQLVRIAIYGIGWSAMEQALNRADFTADELKRLQDRLIEGEANRGFVNGLIGERCMWTVVEAIGFGDNAFGRASGLDVQDMWYELVYRPTGLMDLDGTNYYELFEQMIAANALPVHEQTSKAAAIEAQAIREVGFGSLTAILLPAISRSLDADVRTRAQLRTAIVAVAAARYRADRAEYPDTLDALVPKYLDSVPADPYGGAPIRYHQLENGFVSYSIGQNLQDQNGEELEDINVYRDGDITFSVERKDPAP